MLVRRCGTAVLLGALAIASSAGCRDRKPARSAQAPAAAPPEHEHELAALSLFEQEHRDATDFAAVPPSNRRLGPDPYRIASLHRPDRLIGILRGESAVVAIDRDGVEHARIAAPGSPSGLAIAGDGDIFVVGDNARELAQLRLDKAGDKLER
ncbi:MAG TPA: hypothetical protein VFP84_02910, partial [Kofleriaceae bacterium]|nr:hypothetical protein [Kofleriaceae bacterium]